MNNKFYKYSYKFTNTSLTSISVYNVGKEQCEPLFKWGPGVRDHFLIHHIISGSGKYTVNTRVYELNAGDTFIIYPNTMVSYEADRDKPFEYCWVGFNGSDAPLIMSKTDFSQSSPIIKFNSPKTIEALICDIVSKRGLKFEDDLKMTAGLYNLFSYLIENSQHLKTTDTSVLYLSRAIEYISRNYATDISVTTLSEYIGISRSSLYRIFIRHINMSPAAYINAFRIKKACGLLENNNLSIEQVAISTGFTDQFYFSRVFKKLKGVSPTSYQKNSTSS